LPEVGLADDVGSAVAGEVADAALVDAESLGEGVEVELAAAPVAEQPEGGGEGVVVELVVEPHLAAEDVEPARAGEVGGAEGVAVVDVVEEGQGVPVGGAGGLAVAAVELERSGVVGRAHDHGEPTVAVEVGAEHAGVGHGVVDGVALPRPAGALGLEPSAAAEQFDDAVAIEVADGQALGGVAVAVVGVDGPAVPGLAGRVVGDRDVPERAGVLVPEDELGAAVAVEVAEGLVVVLGLVALEDQATPPRPGRVGVGAGVLPPPQAVAAVVLAGDEVEPAVAGEVEGGAAGLDAGVVGGLDKEGRPREAARGGVTIAGRSEADELGGAEASAHDPLGPAVAVEVGHVQQGLLVEHRGGGQVEGLGGEVVKVGGEGAGGHGAGLGPGSRRAGRGGRCRGQSAANSTS
jgi:hypothetical protein